MRTIGTCGLLVLALAASGCSGGRGDITVPGLPDAGYSGGGLGGPGAFPGGAVAGGTLPGTSISDRILFAVDQSTLSPESTAILSAQVGWLLQNSGAPVLIEGHADERGTGDYNFALGSSRASAVRNFMVSQGIPDTRISIITYGRERPVATCADDSCWSQNRRAVTVVTGAVGA